VARLRATLGAEYLAGIFRTPDDLASQVAAAVSAQGLTRHMVDRVLGETSVAGPEMDAFGRGEEVNPSSLMGIKAMIQQSGIARALVLQVGGGRWWSTRLFLLANLLHTLTTMRQIVFSDELGRFSGMASPAAVIDALSGLPRFDILARELGSGSPSADIDDETERQFAAWSRAQGQIEGGERSLKVSIRPSILERWLGERWVSRCIRVDTADLTMSQVQQIVDSLLPDVPVQRRATGGGAGFQLLVVDRDAFALELAREWVRSGLPRTPVR
jgi:hypothetical protein